MKFNENAQLDPSGVRGGGSGGGRIAVGGIGGLVVILLAMFLGIDPAGLIGEATTTAGASAQPTLQNCRSVGDLDADRECRWVAYQNSIETYWGSAVQGYQPATFSPFRDQVTTACGNATSDVGPFYCPSDRTVYLDESFFDVLEQQFGASGTPAVEAYVMAHEYGHHVQNLVGILNQIDRSTGASSAAVRSELQADCFAGVWFAHASDDPNGPISEISAQDIVEARAAAQAIGDDRIQQSATGRVDRESWTHGSSAQREKWLLTGYRTGDPNQCDTWSASAGQLG